MSCYPLFDLRVYLVNINGLCSIVLGPQGGTWGHVLFLLLYPVQLCRLAVAGGVGENQILLTINNMTTTNNKIIIRVTGISSSTAWSTSWVPPRPWLLPHPHPLYYHIDGKIEGQTYSDSSSQFDSVRSSYLNAKQSSYLNIKLLLW